MMHYAFWISVGLLVYSYLAYPILLFALAGLAQMKRDWRYLFTRSERRQRREELPMVSLVIAAYNEEEVIQKKLDNSLELDYPREKLQIIVGSDGSTDRTNEIVASYADRGVTLINYTDRGGKTNVLNRTIPDVEGELVVLSDANTFYQPETIKHLIRHFTNPKVGCVCGELRLLCPENDQDAEAMYWKIEVMTKFLENKMGWMMSANGAIYAIRKKLFRPLKSHLIADDLLIGVNVKKQGYGFVYDPEAVAYEYTPGDAKEEFRRRIRVAAGSFQSIPYLIPLMNPLKGGAGFAFFSHYILRWFGPFLILSQFLANMALIQDPAYLSLFAAQCVFFIGTFAGYFYTRQGLPTRFVHILYYFIAMNIAQFQGLIRCITRTQRVTWNRPNRTEISRVSQSSGS